MTTFGVRTKKWWSWLAAQWAYVFVVTPLLTDWMETGHLPRRPREFITEVVLGIMLAVGIRIIYRDMARLRTMAETDSLTGLYNRRKFFEDLEHEVIRAQRLGTALSLAYIDVDDFKVINDAHGHAAGDRVLQDIAGLLVSGERREVDSAYRLGGDEFAVLLVGANADEAGAVLERTRQQHGSDFQTLRRLQVSLSYGIAELDPNESPHAFTRRADAMMYDAKRREHSKRLRLG
ncbi:MAG: GGDEF domain-containing protein [Gammaproteobacteria bacterium]